MRNIYREGVSDEIEGSSFQPPVLKILHFVKAVVDIAFFIQLRLRSVFDNKIRFLLKVKKAAKLGHCDGFWKLQPLFCSILLLCYIVAHKEYMGFDVTFFQKAVP